MNPSDVVQTDEGLGVIAWEAKPSFEDRWVVRLENGTMLSTFTERITVIPWLKVCASPKTIHPTSENSA